MVIKAENATLTFSLLTSHCHKMNSNATAEVEHQKLQEASKHLDKNKDGMVTTEELLNPSTLKSGGVRDCEKVKEKLDWKYRRGLTFADFYDMITRFASCTSIGKNKAFCFLFLVPDYLLVMWKMLSTTLIQTTTGRSTWQS